MDSARILVVDDDTKHLSIIRRWLEIEGHDVYTATNGWDALESMVEHRPALTVTDIRMRPMDGFQLIRHLREISNSYVLALTGLSADEHKIHGLELGADEYLTKPVTGTFLRSRVPGSWKWVPAGTPATGISGLGRSSGLFEGRCTRPAQLTAAFPQPSLISGRCDWVAGIPNITGIGV